ncbi:MAG: DDE-type integrase/transposase/recombinase [Promethearchaeota archaeon]
MVGRKKKVYSDLYRSVYVDSEFRARILIGLIQIMCPICGSGLVGTNGTRPRKNRRIEAFQCKNPKCPWKKNHKHGKQFQLTSSYKFKHEIMLKLEDLYTDLFNGAKHKTIAKKYCVSPTQITHLRKAFENALDKKKGLDHLVDVKQPDRAIAIDETFLKIEGKSIYIIIATGYKTHKTLGIKVSTTRNAEDMREVFDEAEKNTKYQILTITLDAWGATIKMAKDLMHEITLIIHKHKKPYDKVVIRRFIYTYTNRVITDIGVKVDVFKRRDVRVYKSLVRIELLLPKTSNKRGRPKGVKNGQGKKKPKSNKKRGRKGLFSVFDNGKKGYMKVDPYRKKLKLSKGCLVTVVAGLNATFKLFAGMSIQNNLAENINSVLQSIKRLKGPKTDESVEKCLRATLKVRNSPELVHEIEIDRNIRGEFFLNNLKEVDKFGMDERGWRIKGLEKIE